METIATPLTEPLSAPVSTDNLKEVILITGSTGFIGSHLADRLAGKYQIVGLDKTDKPSSSDKYELINFDITDEKSIQDAFREVRNKYGNTIASVIHLVAYYSFSGDPSPLYEKVTVDGTRKLLNALQDFQVKQFVFTSTNLVYKPEKRGVKIDESCPIQPNWPYPESKVDTEEVIRNERGNMPAVLLRLAGGYNDWCHSIPISHQIQRIYEKKLTSHFYSGDVHHGNVFLYMDDLMRAFEKTIEARNTLPEIIPINIGEPASPTYQQLQDTIGLLLYGEEWNTIEIPKPIAKAGAWAMDLFGDPFIKPWMIDRANDNYELDITRAEKLLGWSPRHNLLDTLPIMIEHLKTDPEKWYKENKLNKEDDKK